MSVYIDLVFLINFVFDFEMLFVLMKIYCKKIIPWRLFSAAVLGGLQGISVFIPYFKILSVTPIGLLFPQIMVIIVFCPCRIKELITGYLTFILVSFVFSGAVLFFRVNVFAGLLVFVPICLGIAGIRKKICRKRKKAVLFYTIIRFIIKNG